MRAGLLDVNLAEPGSLPSASLKAWHSTAARSASVTLTILRPQTDSISGVRVSGVHWFGGGLGMLTSDEECADLDIEGLELRVVLDAGRLFDLDAGGIGAGEERGDRGNGSEGLHYVVCRKELDMGVRCRS
jgi:hypothetical protein